MSTASVSNPPFVIYEFMAYARNSNTHSDFFVNGYCRAGVDREPFAGCGPHRPYGHYQDCSRAAAPPKEKRNTECTSKNIKRQVLFINTCKVCMVKCIVHCRPIHVQYFHKESKNQCEGSCCKCRKRPTGRRFPTPVVVGPTCCGLLPFGKFRLECKWKSICKRFLGL